MTTARCFAISLAAALVAGCSGNGGGSTSSGGIRGGGSGGGGGSGISDGGGQAGSGGAGSGGVVQVSGGAGGGAGSGGALAGSGGAAASATGGHATAGTGGSGPGLGGHGSGGAAAGGEGGTVASVDACHPRSGLLFCESFENKPAGTIAAAPPWAPQIIGNGTLTVDATIAHSGGKSLRVHAGNDDYDTLLAFHDPAVLPTAGRRFYLRAHVRLGRAMAAGHNSYIVADPAASSGAGNNVRIGEDDAMLMYTVMGDAHGALSNASYYTDHKIGVAFAPSTWVCLEILFDAARPEIDFWVDGTEVPDLHHTDWALDNYETLRFGFEKYAGPAIDIWYDDIAIGTARIGCD